MPSTRIVNGRYVQEDSYEIVKQVVLDDLASAPPAESGKSGVYSRAGRLYCRLATGEEVEISITTVNGGTL